MSDLQDFTVSESGDHLILTSAAGRYQIARADLRSALLPERFSLKGTGAETEATHEGWGHEGQTPVAAKGVGESKYGEPGNRYLFLSRIEWAGGQYSFVDTRPIPIAE
jgi:hypothetical protein